MFCVYYFVYNVVLVVYLRVWLYYIVFGIGLNFEYKIFDFEKIKNIIDYRGNLNYC